MSGGIACGRCCLKDFCGYKSHLRKRVARSHKIDEAGHFFPTLALPLLCGHGEGFQSDQICGFHFLCLAFVLHTLTLFGLPVLIFRLDQGRLQVATSGYWEGSSLKVWCA